MDNQYTSGDPLSELLDDDIKSINRNQLATFLKPYVRIDRSTKELHFIVDSATTIISNESKIEVVLLASKARGLIFDEPEGMTPIEVIQLDIMPQGSVKSSIKKLYDSRKIKKTPTGKYVVPHYRIDEIVNRLERRV